MADERRLNLRFPPELFEQMDEKRFKTRTTFQAIGLHLFEEWVKSDQPAVPRRSARKQREPFLEMAAIVLASGDESLIEMLKKAVEATYGLLQHSLTGEQINQLRAAARGDSGVAPTDRTHAGDRQRLPEEGKRGARKSA